MTGTEHLFAPRPKMQLLQGTDSRLLLGNYFFSYSDQLHFVLVVDASVKSEGTTSLFHNKLKPNILYKAIGRDEAGFSTVGFISHSFSNSLYIYGQIILLV